MKTSNFIPIRICTYKKGGGVSYTAKKTKQTCLKISHHAVLTKLFPWASEPRHKRIARATIVTTSKPANAHW